MNTFEYLDYKQLVRDRIKARPKGGRGEMGRLATHLGVHPTLISQVLQGSKDFSTEQAYSVGEFLGLNALEAEYFLTLVQEARAGSVALKKFFQKKIQSLSREALNVSKRVKVEKVLNDTERARFYSDWLYSAIRAYCSIDNGKSLAEIAERFSAPIKDINSAVEFLVQSGLCVREGEVYKVGAKTTHLEYGSPFLPQHLRNWHIKAIERCGRQSEEELMYSLCVSIGKQDFARLRERLVETIQQVLGTVKETEPEELACLNIDWLWLGR